jgi:iron only hydrogenase large subunit-like protein
VRTCPVKAIKITAGGQIPVFIPDRCIGCGNCVSSCTPNAIIYRDSKTETKELLASDNKVIAICDPAIASEFSDISDYRKFVQMLKSIGFSEVYEVSFGVDLVAKAYRKLFSNFRGKHYISANCPVVVSYIEKFFPDLINNLAPIVSPMIATAKVVKKVHGNEVKIVHIGPCLACKDEVKRYADDVVIDAVLTFEELRELFDEFNINESKVEFSDFNQPLGFTGSLYPISNGIIQAADLNENLITSSIITVDGKTNVLQSIKEFDESISTINNHLNLFYCKGCLMGPGTTKEAGRLLRRTMVTSYANKRLKTFDHEVWDKNIQTYKSLDLSCSFTPDDQRLPSPSAEKIKEILRTIEKYKPEDEVGCTSCGYATCRDFADAIAKGLTIPEMCTTFTLHNQQNYIKSLKTTNEKLAHTQAALKTSEHQARVEHETAKEASETTTAMLQKLPAGIVIIDKNLKIVQANQSFINMLGEDAQEINEVVPGLVGADLKSLLPYNLYNIVSFVLNTNDEVVNKDVSIDEQMFNLSVFPIKKNKIVGAVLRDMSSPEVRKEEIVSRVSEVIDKNLEMVQQIGYLLGEGASETERMLNSIIQTYKSDKK